MTKKNRRIAFVLVLTVFFVMLSSVFYISAEAEHDCSGENCLICYQINLCKNVLKSAGQIIPVIFFVSLTYIFSGVLPFFPNALSYHPSLITLKVKLSD